jgi:hypothetical protein
MYVCMCACVCESSLQKKVHMYACVHVFVFTQDTVYVLMPKHEKIGHKNLTLVCAGIIEAQSCTQHMWHRLLLLLHTYMHTRIHVYKPTYGMHVESTSRHIQVPFTRGRRCCCITAAAVAYIHTHTRIQTNIWYARNINPGTVKYLSHAEDAVVASPLLLLHPSRHAHPPAHYVLFRSCLHYLPLVPKRQIESQFHAAYCHHRLCCLSQLRHPEVYPQTHSALSKSRI